ncbi:hypothetical protein TURU_169303 [Turdus rufiventris]|nr:hypothetical protein TURU_169303 [Turdus rufiventris]
MQLSALDCKLQRHEETSQDSLGVSRGVAELCGHGREFLKCVISMIANITIENKVKPKPTSGSLPWDCFRYRANNIKEAMLPFTGVEVDLGNFTSEDNLENIYANVNANYLHEKVHTV